MHYRLVTKRTGEGQSTFCATVTRKSRCTSVRCSSVENIRFRSVLRRRIGHMSNWTPNKKSIVSTGCRRRPLPPWDLFRLFYRKSSYKPFWNLLCIATISTFAIIQTIVFYGARKYWTYLTLGVGAFNTIDLPWLMLSVCIHFIREPGTRYTERYCCNSGSI